VCDQFDFNRFFAPSEAWVFARPKINPGRRNCAADSAKTQKAQDRDGDEEIANSSVLKIGMKNAVLRGQATLSARPAPKRPARRASAAGARLLFGMRREQQLLEARKERVRFSCVVSFEIQKIRELANGLAACGRTAELQRNMLSFATACAERNSRNNR